MPNPHRKVPVSQMSIRPLRQSQFYHRTSAHTTEFDAPMNASSDARMRTGLWTMMRVGVECRPVASQTRSLASMCQYLEGGFLVRLGGDADGEVLQPIG